METRGQTLQFNLPLTSAKGTLNRTELQAPRHPGFERAEQSTADKRDAGYNIYLISLRNLINDRMQSFIKTEPRESGKQEPSQFSQGNQSRESSTHQSDKGARGPTDQGRSFTDNVSLRDGHGIYLASANQFLLPKFYSSPASTPRSGESQNKEPRKNEGRESSQTFSTKPTVNQEILNEKKTEQPTSRFGQQRENWEAFPEFFSSKRGIEQKAAGKEAPAQRGAQQPVKGQEAPAQRGVQQPVRGQEAPAQRGAQTPVRGQEAPAQRGVQQPVRGQEAPAQRGVQQPVRGQEAPAQRGAQTPVRGQEAPAQRGAQTPVRGQEAPAQRGAQTPVRGQEAPAQRGAQTPVRGQEAPTQRGAQTPVRGQEAPAQRGAQTPVRGQEAPAQRGAQTPVRGQEAPAQRGAQTPVRGQEAPAEQGQSPLNKNDGVFLPWRKAAPARQEQSQPQLREQEASTRRGVQPQVREQEAPTQRGAQSQLREQETSTQRAVQPQVRPEMQRPSTKEPSSEKTQSEAAVDKKRSTERRGDTARADVLSPAPSSQQKVPQQKTWTGGTLKFSVKSSETEKSPGLPSDRELLKGDSAKLKAGNDEQKFTTLTGKTYSFNDAPAGKQNQLTGSSGRTNTASQQGMTKEPSLNNGRLDQTASQSRKDDVMNAYIRSFKNAGAEFKRPSAASSGQMQEAAANKERPGNQEPEKSPPSLREKMASAFSENKAKPEMALTKGMEQTPKQKGASGQKSDSAGKPEGMELSSKKESALSEKGFITSLRTEGDTKNSAVKEQHGSGIESAKTPHNEETAVKKAQLPGMDNELQSENPDSAQKKTSFDAYKSVFKNINKTGQPGLHEAATKETAAKETAQQEAAPKEAAAQETGRPDISKSRENQLPLPMKSAPVPEEKKQPQLTLTKEKEAGEMLQPEKLHELKEERETLGGKKPAAEHQVVQSSEFFKASAKKESEKLQSETTGKADEEIASPKEKTVEQKAPLREKSFIAAARDRKSPSDETQSTMRGDGPAGQSMSQLSERATLMTSWTSGMAAQEEVRSSSHRSGSTKDKDKFSSVEDRQTIEAVERRDRDFNQSKSDQDSSQDGSSQERAKAGITRKQQGTLSGTPSQDQPSKAPEQQPHDYFRKETTKQQLDERIKVFQASKEQPLKHTMQAAQHATTSIESILKKSQKETWTGDEMAAKLIALLMKSSSEYTYDHSTRVIDLSVMLAKEMGINDEKSLKDIEEGAMFHDIGEVELDLEKAPEGVKKRLSNYIGIADLKNCSFLHDIGKIKIPEEILYKPSRLTNEEYEVLKQHPIIGEQILKPIPSLQHVLPVVRHHHERWDGKGYPDGLEGAETPQSARIISITDAFDAMISDRPYRKGMPVQEAMKEIKKGAGTQFDPTLVEAFLKVVEKQYL